MKPPSKQAGVRVYIKDWSLDSSVEEMGSHPTLGIFPDGDHYIELVLTWDEVKKLHQKTGELMRRNESGEFTEPESTEVQRRNPGDVESGGSDPVDASEGTSEGS